MFDMIIKLNIMSFNNYDEYASINEHFDLIH